jgi:diguanylate cyclase (GGDEF)-like protein
MQGRTITYNLPRWRLTRWLADAGPDVPHDIRAAMIGGLFGTLPVFAGGVLNTLAVSGTIAARMQTAPFIAWFILEVVICTARLAVLMTARRAAREGRDTLTDIYLVLGVAWSAGVGYGLFISMMSGDWVAAALACISSAAMVGGICFRNFSAPRLAATMIVASLGPSVPAAALAGEPLMYVVFFQIPMYVVAMTRAAFKLNKMLIATKLAERENDHRARHDALTGLSNRMGLADAVDARLVAANGIAMPQALLFIDLDGFKAVNDTHGHAAGDGLLKMVAGRLIRMLPPDGLAARIGGDEFVALMPASTPAHAAEFGDRLVAIISAPYDLGDGISARIGVSVGVALAPEHGAGLADLLAVADAALYEAKSRGKSRCCLASTATSVAALRRLHQEGTERARAGAAA